MELIDALGRVVLSSPVSANNIDLDVTRIPEGVYTVNVQVDGTITVERLVIQH